MITATLPNSAADVDLAEFVGQYYADPLGYFRVAFPWGEKGTKLEYHKGPCSCQRKIAAVWGEEIRKRAFNGHTPAKPIRIAVGSGHGIGKTGFFGMADNFIRSTRPRCRGMVTASTGDQLDTKTWAGIREWNKLSITGHWFEDTSERIYRVGERDSWFSSALTWSEEKPEAFAGLHAADSSPYYLNDEASGIADCIFEVQRGGVTDGEPFQFLFGNLTKPTGFFARVMNGEERGWILIRIDSRECELTNKDEIGALVEEYGEDSDIVRVRVRGLPPKTHAGQYFSSDLIMACQTALPRGTKLDALVAAVDFAWGGNDPNTVRFRHGLDAWSIPYIQVAGEETSRPERMIGVLADVLTKTYPVEGGAQKVAMLFMDNSGIASQVALGLRNLGFASRICEVNFGGHPVNPDKHKNVRAQIMERTKDLMQKGLGIGKSKDLAEDLRYMQPVNYVPLQFMKKELIRKELAKVRSGGRTSTDHLDTLAMTTYMPVRLPELERLANTYGQSSGNDVYRPASAYS